MCQKENLRKVSKNEKRLIRRDFLRGKDFSVKQMERCVLTAYRMLYIIDVN